MECKHGHISPARLSILVGMIEQQGKCVRSRCHIGNREIVRYGARRLGRNRYVLTYYMDGQVRIEAWKGIYCLYVVVG
jgi:hypothetical protein